MPVAGENPVIVCYCNIESDDRQKETHMMLTHSNSRYNGVLLDTRSKKAYDMIVFTILKTAEYNPIIHDHGSDISTRRWKVTCSSDPKTLWGYKYDVSNRVMRDAAGAIIVNPTVQLKGEAGAKSFAKLLGEFVKEAMLNHQEFSYFVNKSEAHYSDKCAAFPEATLGEVFCLIGVLGSLQPATLKRMYGEDAYLSMTSAKINPLQQAQRETLLKELDRAKDEHDRKYEAIRKKFNDLMAAEQDTVDKEYEAKQADIAAKLAALG